MRSLLSIVLVTVALFLAGCDTKKEDAKSSVAAVKEVFKDGDKVELKSVSGAKLSLLRKNGGFVIEDDEGKIILFDIFGTFCAPCQEEAPALMDFQLQNSSDVMLVGLNFFEEVSDEYVVENFAAKYNAYYFISNSPINKKLANTIVQDIAYKGVLQVPFKVVLKDGKYQEVTDTYEPKAKQKFYIGKVSLDTIQSDIDFIKSK